METMALPWNSRRSALLVAGLLAPWAPGCAKAPVDWQWIGGPPGPLTLTAAAPVVMHGKSVVVTATGGVGHYQITFDDSGAGGSLVTDASGNTATYQAPSSGDAATVTFTVTSVSETASATVTVPASGAPDTRCGTNGFSTFEFCADCEDTANALVLRGDELDLFGASYAPSAIPVPNARYGVRTVSARDLTPIGNRWGQTDGALRIDPGRTLNNGNAIVGASLGPGGSVFYGGLRPTAGMLFGRLDPTGAQPSNFDGAGGTTRLFSDSRYNPRGISWNSGVGFVGVPAAYQPAAAQDSVRIDWFDASGIASGTSVVTYPAAGMTLETSNPFVLPLPGGLTLVPSASHDNGTFGVPRFKVDGSLDGTWNGSGFRLMQTLTALSSPWGPQAAKLTATEVYLAGAKGGTIFLNAMNLVDGSVRRSTVSFGGSGHVVSAVLPQPDGGALVLGSATQTIQQGFIVRFRKAANGDLEPDVDAFGGNAVVDDVFLGASGSSPYSVEAATLDAEGRILAVGWRNVSGRNSMIAACLFP